MNIALFLDCFTPMKNGVITSALQLKEGLEKRGHHVVVVAVKVKGYINHDPNVLLFPQISLDFGSKQGFGLGLITQRKLLPYLKEHRIELIHTHTEASIGWAGKKAAKKLRLPRIVTTHTMWEQYANYLSLLKITSLVRGYLKCCYKGADAIVAPSIKAQKYDRMIVPEIPIHIIPNGIDISKFHAAITGQHDLSDIRTQYGLAPDNKVLTFVGRIGPEKRVMELLYALAPLLQKHTNIKLLYIGDGPETDRLKDRARMLALDQQVLFTGFIAWEQVHKFYALSSIFVTASLSEVHSMTVIEAAMSGLPVITRRDDSFLDLIEPGKNGYLADTDNQIAQQAESLLFDAQKMKLFSAASYQLSQKFTVEIHVDRMEELYNNVVRQHV